MTDVRRGCACPHGFPLCACDGATGPEMLRRSRHLSALAGWPGPLTPDGLAEAEALRARWRAGARAAKPRVPKGGKLPGG